MSGPRLLLLGVLALLGACGDGYDLPALAAAESPSIRVLLVPDSPRLGIHEQSWEITSEGGRPYVRRGSGTVDATLGVAAGVITIGREATGATALRVAPAAHFTLDGRPYAGHLLAFVHDGALRLVNEVDLETYVAGVIGNEMGPDAPVAAYRAQAVAARTYAFARLVAGRDGDRPFHVYDTQASQVYTGLRPRYDIDLEAMRRATAQTRGVMLTWDNQPFPAYYASTCGGHTTDARLTSLLDPEGAEEPLRGVPCGFCTESSRFTWSHDVTDEAVIEGMRRIRRPIKAPVRSLAIVQQGPGGWARQAEVGYGGEGDVRRLPGTELRRALRLESHHITRIARIPGGWRIDGRGWGHGVGMCQMGARGMAERGMTEVEILRWYYPGAALNRVY